jgi:hypothetical protein
MGEVYRADDLRLGQPVALKFLPPVVASEPARLAQFHNEVRTARQVSHPNVCRVYDIGESSGQLFLSMEFIDGQDLATSLRRIGRFPEDKALDVARQLCAGLAAAHARGIVHRDLKPANVMLDDAGHVRIMDFGLAAAGAVDDVRAGTPAYMAPEQLLGREVTPRSDIYALGLVLYELFTGRRAFSPTSLNDLIAQQQSGRVTPPSSIVTSMDPAIERAILRCLHDDPARRPASALAVAAALPGGDPLAAALAAGETPSPEMVTAAGEGAGLSRRHAAWTFAATIGGLIVAYAMALESSALQRVRPQFPPDVLAQKARDALTALGYADRPQDEAYGLAWDEKLSEHKRSNAASGSPWSWVEERPSPLYFWYRRSESPMVALQFHHDLLTPGIVDVMDPAPIQSGMMYVRLDARGFLTHFEAVPPQIADPPAAPATLDWAPLLALAGLEVQSLQPSTPRWHWLASADTRAAWTGTWPRSNDALRVEAAALHGRPVAFAALGSWSEPWRTPAESGRGAAAAFAILFVMALVILVAGAALARKHLRQGRGDRAGALRLGTVVAVALWLLWLCQVHVSASIGMIGIFMLAVVTTVFYGVLFWALYLALEPFVRRHWPQSLVSWTTMLSGRVRDPVVGRDVLVGVGLGASIALLIRTATWFAPVQADWVSTDYLLGVRASIGALLSAALYAVRTALLIFFLLFLIRLAVGGRWVGGLVFMLLFAAPGAFEADTPLLNFVMTLAYSGLMVGAAMRWGLTTLTVGTLTANLLLNAPATTDWSAWYVGASMLVIGVPAALATWGFMTSISQPARTRA